MQGTQKAAQGTTFLTMLEKMVEESCHCKLRTKCLDKASPACLKHHNLYAEAMLENRVTKL